MLLFNTIKLQTLLCVGLMTRVPKYMFFLQQTIENVMDSHQNPNNNTCHLWSLINIFDNFVNERRTCGMPYFPQILILRCRTRKGPNVFSNVITLLYSFNSTLKDWKISITQRITRFRLMDTIYNLRKFIYK